MSSALSPNYLLHHEISSRTQTHSEISSQYKLPSISLFIQIKMIKNLKNNEEKNKIEREMDI
jgi:hypothetical protein